jgi:hypothetical protein
VVGQAVEQRGGHFGVTEDARPFTECQVIPTLTMSDRRLPNRGERWT